MHVISLDLFNLDVGVFTAEDDRLEVLAEQGCSDLDRHSDAALASAHRDYAEDGSVRFSMVIKPEATDATLAHECVHIADFVMDYLQLPMGIKNTEVRAYLVGYLFANARE